MDKQTLDTLYGLYGLVTNVYQAPDIRTADAAKVIENVQRDLNIALMNELSMIFARLGISKRIYPKTLADQCTGIPIS